MTIAFRPTSNTVDIGTTANTIYSSKAVYVFNNSASNQMIKINNANTAMIAPNSFLVLYKASSDAVLCANGIATAIKVV